LIESFSTAVSRLVLIENQNIWKRQELWKIVASSTVYTKWIKWTNNEKNWKSVKMLHEMDKLSDAAVLNMWQLHKMLHAMDPLIKYQASWLRMLGPGQQLDDHDCGWIVKSNERMDQYKEQEVKSNEQTGKLKSYFFG
jgi:hypothetical protein